MLAPASEINSAWQFYFFDDWLKDAGTDASVTTRILKVQDEDAYNALLSNEYYLPDIWKKGAEGTKVLNKDGGEIK